MKQTQLNDLVTEKKEREREKITVNQEEKKIDYYNQRKDNRHR